ncbi:MAG: beta-lactamase family protein [Candidatus Hydrogenedentes bacterium]|nr:beta-lactamase family protein [Candidatus Hydrogenedentota bacterium]
MVQGMQARSPLRVLAFLIAACACIADDYVSGRGVYRGELGARLNAYMEAAEKDGYSGSILVERGKQVVIAAGYGWADREKQRRFTQDTIFDIGSITKQFTAAAIMKLKEAGKLDVHDPMGKYIPGVPADKQSITLHHLLTHTSGMKDIFGGDFDRSSREQFLGRALSSELRRPPGTRYAYSNAGYSLLGVVIEEVSGQSYEQFLRETLFKPGGMDHTGYVLPQWDRDSVVHLYQKGKDWGSPLEKPWLPDGPGWNLRCNGGILSTLEDMRKWHHALLRDTVLARESKDAMFTPYVPESERGQSHYGYGWSIRTTTRGTHLITHNGGNGVFETDVRRYVDENTLVIMTASVAEKPLVPCERGALEILFPDAK